MPGTFLDAEDTAASKEDKCPCSWGAEVPVLEADHKQEKRVDIHRTAGGISV